jgi:protein-S-isoprenylcysteine O-methyltransferase Ste14
MALVNSFEKSGNFLFKHRGEIPVVLFVLAIPVIYYTPVDNISSGTKTAITALAIFLSTLGFVIRAVSIATTPKGTSGRNTKKGQIAESLNTKGIYSVVRHPLYLGNYFMWIGIVVFTYNWIFVIVISLLFWLYYERIMFAEERFLERKFGEEYMRWANDTPAFVPCLRKYVKGDIPFSFKSILRREYSGMLATVVSFVFVYDLRLYFHDGTFKLDSTAHYILLAAAVIALTLRTLKHNTNILMEEGRS